MIANWTNAYANQETNDSQGYKFWSPFFLLQVISLISYISNENVRWRPNTWKLENQKDSNADKDHTSYEVKSALNSMKMFVGNNVFAEN